MKTKKRIKKASKRYAFFKEIAERPIFGCWSSFQPIRRPRADAAALEDTTPWTTHPSFRKEIQLPHDLLR